MILKFKTYKIARNPKYNKYERGLVSADNFLDNKTVLGAKVNEELDQELYKPVAKKLKKKKMYAKFKDNIFPADLAETMPLSTNN